MIDNPYNAEQNARMIPLLQAGWWTATVTALFEGEEHDYLMLFAPTTETINTIIGRFASAHRITKSAAILLDDPDQTIPAGFYRVYTFADATVCYTPATAPRGGSYVRARG